MPESGATSLMDTTSANSAKETATASSDTASTSYQPFPEMTSEQEFFLYELESTDTGSIGLVLRAIYDCGDVSKFTCALEHRIRQYDKNIQKVCSFHYQGFIDSMKQLLQLKEKCTAIKEETLQIDEAVQSTSRNIAQRTAEIVKYRKQMRNAIVAMNQLSVCIPVLDNYAKLHDLIKQRKYFPALKVLEELEHTHFALVEKYRFTQDLAKAIEPLRAEIKKNTYSELKDFLEVVKKVACRIGRHASKSTAEMHSFGVTDAERARRLQEEAKKNVVDVQITVSSDGSLVNNTLQQPKPIQRRTSDYDDSEQLSAQDLIDFSPIHRCWQIFCVLDSREEFETYYRTQRTEQCDMVIRARPKLNSLKNYVDYLDEMIGFFVVEDHIVANVKGLVPIEHKDVLWKKASETVFDVLNSDFGKIEDVATMIRMKKVVLLFALTMKSYAYDITRLYQLLKQFTTTYTEMLMVEYAKQFERDLESDNYTPIQVETEEEFRAIVKQFPFYKRSLEIEPFPRRFAFSRFVMAVFTQSKSYLVNCLKFMEHLQMPQHEIEDDMRKFANLLLVRLSEHLKQYIQNSKRTFVQLVQITINIGYLEKSCESLDPFITRITNGGEAPPTSTGHLVALSEKVFRDARSEAEQKIEDLLQKKVDAFLDLAEYDWELPSSSGIASDFISDLINFLSSTFSSFTNLPSVLARHVCMQICKYLADRLTELLLSPDSRSITSGALEQFSLDVMQCEVFTARCPVAGFDEHTLPVTFATLRQLLDLVMTSDWTTYLAEYRNDTRKYNRVKASVALQLLEKIIELEKKSAGFFSVKSGDRKKLLETVHRQLKLLSADR